MAEVLPHLDLLRPHRFFCPRSSSQPNLAIDCPQRSSHHARLPLCLPPGTHSFIQQNVYGMPTLNEALWRAWGDRAGVEQQTDTAPTSENIRLMGRWPPVLHRCIWKTLTTQGGTQVHTHYLPPVGTSRCFLPTFTVSSKELSLSHLCHRLAHSHHLSSLPR